MPTKAELEAQLAELKAAEAKPAPKKRTVKLPPMLKLDGVGIQVDPTYSRNLAVFTLKSDGEVATKGDGTVKKPKRIPVSAVQGILDHPDEIAKMIEASRALTQPAQAS